MELCALDVLLNSKNEHWILELNGSAIGIPTDDWKDDSLKIVDMVIERMNGIYAQGKSNQPTKPKASATASTAQEDKPKEDKTKKDKSKKTYLWCS